ncbi:MAG: dihydroorotate dehydrogenase electron transfer subunit [Clostridiales bacterium]|nr:dihydroorotate dehydrogenase electron transfer subunit [Clostridiales bacterium]
MADVKKTLACIKTKNEISPQIFDMWLENSEIASKAKPGQFLSIYMKEGSRLLPRPISICEVDKEQGRLRIVYRIAGKGTAELSDYAVNDMIEIMGPLGNGFYMDEVKSAILIGGGIGIPPMLELAKQLKCKKTIVLGYRDTRFLSDEFATYGDVVIATEDGSFGTKGNVVDAMNEHHLSADMIFACGPTPMLRGVKTYATEHGIKVQISMEEKMACGIGACLACVCKSKEKDHHTNVNNKRVCKDGPVFFADEIEL